MIIWRSSCGPALAKSGRAVVNSGSDGSQLRQPGVDSWSDIKKAEALPLLAPGKTRAPGPRLRKRSCRVAVKEEDLIHSRPATVAAAKAGVKSYRLARGQPRSWLIGPSAATTPGSASEPAP